MHFPSFLQRAGIVLYLQKKLLKHRKVHVENIFIIFFFNLSISVIRNAHLLSESPGTGQGKKEAWGESDTEPGVKVTLSVCVSVVSLGPPDDSGTESWLLSRR